MSYKILDTAYESPKDCRPHFWIGDDVTRARRVSVSFSIFFLAECKSVRSYSVSQATLSHKIVGQLPDILHETAFRTLAMSFSSEGASK